MQTAKKQQRSAHKAMALQDTYVGVARILSAQFKLKVLFNAGHPRTDGKVIYLPQMPYELDADSLLIFKSHLVHEVAHVRYSDFEYFSQFVRSNTPFARGLLMSLEDAWIEHNLGKDFRGSGQTIARSIPMLNERGELKIGGVNAAEAFQSVAYFFGSGILTRWPQMEGPYETARAKLLEWLGEGSEKVVEAAEDLIREKLPRSRSTADNAALTLELIELLHQHADESTEDDRSDESGKSEETENDCSEPSGSGASDEESEGDSEDNSQGGNQQRSEDDTSEGGDQDPSESSDGSTESSDEEGETGSDPSSNASTDPAEGSGADPEASDDASGQEGEESESGDSSDGESNGESASGAEAGGDPNESDETGDAGDGESGPSSNTSSPQGSQDSSESGSEGGDGQAGSSGPDADSEQGNEGDAGACESDGSKDGTDQGNQGASAKGAGGRSDGSADSETAAEGGQGASDDKDVTSDPTLGNSIRAMLEQDPGEGEVVDYAKLLAELADQMAKDPRTRNAPKVIQTDQTGERRASEHLPLYNEARASIQSQTGTVAARLQLLLQSMTYEELHTSTSGRLQSNKIVRLVTGNPRAFGVKEEHLLPRTAVSVLADLSGSTQGHPATLIQQTLILLSEAMQMVGNPVELLGFGSRPGRYHDLTVVKTFDEPHALSKARLGGVIDDVGGGTPLSEALLETALRLMVREEDRKVLFVITDGIPDDPSSSVEITHRALKGDQEVFYFLVGSSVPDWLQVSGIPHAMVRDVSAIGREVLSVLQKVLMR